MLFSRPGNDKTHAGDPQNGIHSAENGGLSVYTATLSSINLNAGKGGGMTLDELTDDERAFLDNYRELDGLDRLRVRQRLDDLLNQQREEKKKDFNIQKGGNNGELTV